MLVPGPAQQTVHGHGSALPDLPESEWRELDLNDSLLMNTLFPPETLDDVNLTELVSSQADDPAALALLMYMYKAMGDALAVPLRRNQTMPCQVNIIKSAIEYSEDHDPTLTFTMAFTDGPPTLLGLSDISSLEISTPAKGLATVYGRAFSHLIANDLIQNIGSLRGTGSVSSGGR